MHSQEFWRKKNLQPSSEVTADIGSLAFYLQGAAKQSTTPHQEKKNALCFNECAYARKRQDSNPQLRCHNLDDAISPHFLFDLRTL